MIAEIETDIPEPALGKAPTPHSPIANEYASPVFVKRSRASYGPLFELFDEELEEDGGRRGKGRKRPRYSVERGRWRYREDSSSPEPDPTTEASSAPEPSNENTTKQTSPSKPVMADGGCQTNDFELPPPPPSSSFNTPLKRWGNAESSPLFAMGMARAAAGPRMDMGVQASHSVPGALVSEQHHDTALASDTRSTLGIAASYPDLFGTPQKAVRPFSNTASSFATAQTPTQLTFSQPIHASTPFGSGSSRSVGFKFGQPPPHSTINAPPFAQSQAPAQHHDDHHPYPESYLAADAPTNLPPTISHNPFSAETGPQPYVRQDIDNAKESHALQYWTTAASADPIQRSGLPDSLDEGHSDESMRENTLPSTIPPHVEDGTRNQDEMEQGGLLTRSVYRQGVPEEALPDQGDVSAGDEDGSMDSDEQADYDEEEKGDDYDLRNYNRVSDDEEGYDEEEPLSDEELLEDEQYDDEEEDYDEDEDEEDRYERPSQTLKAPRSYLTQQAHPPAPPKVSKEPIVIDLLSDSDDEEPPAPQPARSQVQQFPPANLIKSEPIENATNPVHESQPLDTSEPEHETSEDEQESEFGGDIGINGLDGQVEASDAEEELYEGDDVSEEDIEESEDVADEPDAGEDAEDIVSVERSQVTVTTTSIVADENQAAASSPAQDPHSDKSDEDINMDKSPTVKAKCQVTKEEVVIEERHENVMESFQTQPAEMLASFETQTSAAAQSSEIELVDPEDDVDEDETRTDGIGEAKLETKIRRHINEDSDEWGQEDEAPQENVTEDKAREIDPQTEIEDERQDLSSDGVEEMEEPVDDTAAQQPAEEMELDPEGSEDDLESKSAKSALGKPGLIEGSNEQDAPPPTATSRHNETFTVAKVDTSLTTSTTSHIETQLSDTQSSTLETQETDSGSSRPATSDKNIATVAKEQDTEMADTVPSPEGEVDLAEVDDASSPFQEDVDMADSEGPLEVENDAEDLEDAPVESNQDDEVMDTIVSPEDGDIAVDDAPPTSNEDGDDDVKNVNSKSPSPKGDGIKDAGQVDESVPSILPQTSAQDAQAAQSPESVPPQVDGTHSDEDEEFHDVSEILEAENFSPIIPYDENSSFMTANSEVSEMPESEGTEPTSTAKRKRAGRNTRDDLSINFKRTRPASFELSPSRQRTTRSKAMTFQTLSSPKNDKEDMSIQLARAALKSPTSRKASSAKTTSSKLKTSLVKRLADEMPECVPLKDLRKFNNRTLDVAVVAVSALTTPKRTPVRDYVSSLTVTDPSLASCEGVVEVTIFSLHRDHLPVVKAGDSMLLRSFTVQALPGKGWGLKSDKNVSSWAVFEADGNDAPQTRAAPVELDDEEQKYLVDLRGWYASLDDGAKENLGKAVGALIDKGREARGEK